MSDLGQITIPQEDDWKDEDFLSFDAGPAVSADARAEDAAELQCGPAAPAGPGRTDLPPWMDRAHARGCPRLTALHNEVVQFVHLMEPTAAELRQRLSLIDRVRSLIQTAFGGQARVEVFGSQATGLLLPSSDIDLVVLFDEDEHKQKLDYENNNAQNALPPRSPLHAVADALRSQWLSELSYLEVIEQTRVPLVKFTHAATGTSVDISFQQGNGPQAAALMRTYLEALPPLRPLTICLKYFLALRDLNQPYTGGIGSYMLQLMIVSMLQHRAREAAYFRRPNVDCLGCLLLEFFELYGFEFNYITTAISVRHDGYYFPKGSLSKREIFWQPTRPFSCAIENPLDTTMDVGQPSFRMQQVQRSFAVAYKTLLAHLAEPAVPALSILATIMDASDEMLSRKHHKETEQPLPAKRVGEDHMDRDRKQRKRRRHP